MQSIVQCTLYVQFNIVQCTLYSSLQIKTSHVYCTAIQMTVQHNYVCLLKYSVKKISELKMENM
jgi:hypothetical protein